MPRQTVTNKTDLLSFGKYKGKSVSLILKTQPGYILQLHAAGLVEFPEDLVIEAEEESESRDPKTTYAARDKRQYTPGAEGL
jgi:hypothetical protein